MASFPTAQADRFDHGSLSFGGTFPFQRTSLDFFFFFFFFCMMEIGVCFSIPVCCTTGALSTAGADEGLDFRFLSLHPQRFRRTFYILTARLCSNDLHGMG